MAPAAPAAKAEPKRLAAPGGAPGYVSGPSQSSAPSAYEALLGKRPGEGMEGSEERRTKLRRYDKMAAQCLNPEGVSPIHKADLRGVWEMAMAGNKGAQYFSELCDADDYRRGVGISRAAEAILSMGAALEQPVFKAVVQEPVLKRALAEWTKLKAHLAVLNGGKASATTKTSTSLWAQANQKQAEKVAVPEASDVEAAATYLYEFLGKKDSALRAFAEIQSQGGVFYSAHVADKVLRAAIEYGEINKELFCTAAKKRLSDRGRSPEKGPADELTEAYKALGVQSSS